MTTIAYRDGMLAADSQVNGAGGRLGFTTKVGRAPDGTIGAVAGQLRDTAAFVQWLEAGAEGDPPHLFDEDADGILIRPDGTTFAVEATSDGKPAVLSPMQAPFLACGSGWRYALGAMAMGADAVKAVEIAAQFDTGTGGPVQLTALPGRVLRR